MPNTDQNKPGSKAGRRNRKVEQRSHKSDKQTSRVTEQRQEPEQEFAATPEFNEVAPINAAAEAADLTPLKTAAGRSGLATIDQAAQSAQALVSGATALTAAAVPSTAANVQAIANAYGDFTRKSFEQTRTYVERLARARSLDKVIEVQVEFAKQSYETFLSDMQRICGLHTELAKQSFRPLERFVAKATQEAQQGLNGGGLSH